MNLPSVVASLLPCDKQRRTSPNLLAPVANKLFQAYWSAAFVLRRGLRTVRRVFDFSETAAENFCRGSGWRNASQWWRRDCAQRQCRRPVIASHWSRKIRRSYVLRWIVTTRNEASTFPNTASSVVPTNGRRARRRGTKANPSRPWSIACSSRPGYVSPVSSGRQKAAQTHALAVRLPSAAWPGKGSRLTQRPTGFGHSGRHHRGIRWVRCRVSVSLRGADRIFLRRGLKLRKQKPRKGKIACD